MKVYKGTDKDMKCQGFQYELGETAISDNAIRCGDKGFHSCEAPFDVLRYYPNKNGNRYFEAESGGKIDCTRVDDSKLASSELTLKSEIGLQGLIKAQIEYIREKAESSIAGGRYSNLVGGSYSNLVGGSNSNLAGGNFCLIVGRNGCKAKGGKNSVIVLTECEYSANGKERKPVCVKAEIVDGERIKENTWYTLENGEFSEITE